MIIFIFCSNKILRGDVLACGEILTADFKVMRLNRPKAKICFKLNTNWLLTDFFDPKSSPDLLDSISDTNFKSKFDLYQKLVEFNQKWSKTNGFGHFRHCF